MSLEAETLEHRLQQEAEAAEEAARSEMEARALVDQMEEDLQERQIATFAITSDHVREYKATQEELICRINALEMQLMEGGEELDITNHELQELVRDRDEDIEDRGRQILQLNQRMREMQAEFMNMLSETMAHVKVHLAELPDGEGGPPAEFAQQVFAHGSHPFGVPAQPA